MEGNPLNKKTNRVEQSSLTDEQVKALGFAPKDQMPEYPKDHPLPEVDIDGINTQPVEDGAETMGSIFYGEGMFPRPSDSEIAAAKEAQPTFEELDGKKDD